MKPDFILVNIVVVDNMRTKNMFIVRLLKKYPRVVISQRNNGLGDNLLAAANAWYYAKHTNRTLVIVW